MKKYFGAIFFALVFAVGAFLVMYLAKQRTELDNKAFIQWRYEHAIKR